MRKLLLFLSLLFGGAAAAQPLVCTEPGTVLEYAQYDESGRLTDGVYALDGPLLRA